MAAIPTRKTWDPGESIRHIWALKRCNVAWPWQDAVAHALLPAPCATCCTPLSLILSCTELLNNCSRRDSLQLPTKLVSFSLLLALRQAVLSSRRRTQKPEAPIQQHCSTCYSTTQMKGCLHIHMFCQARTLPTPCQKLIRQKSLEEEPTALE